MQKSMPRLGSMPYGESSPNRDLLRRRRSSDARLHARTRPKIHGSRLSRDARPAVDDTCMRSQLKTRSSSADYDAKLRTRSRFFSCTLCRKCGTMLPARNFESSPSRALEAYRFAPALVEGNLRQVFGFGARVKEVFTAGSNAPSSLFPRMGSIARRQSRLAPRDAGLQRTRSARGRTLTTRRGSRAAARPSAPAPLAAAEALLFRASRFS